MKPRGAETDVAECPVLAGALIVDSKVTVLETQFFQIVAVESGFADAVDP